MELERLIEEARASGTLDSSGRFTLDLERAWEKLGQYGSSQPAAFVLYLVRAAVGSGASSVKLSHGWWSPCSCATWASWIWAGPRRASCV